MQLDNLKENEEAIILKVKGYGAFRKRVKEMGFVRGQKVSLVKNAPFKDPIEYKIMDYNVSLRKSEASLIEVAMLDEINDIDSFNYNGVIDEEKLKTSTKEKGYNINVALVGNPNAGKTSLFNNASGAKEHVGNYSGVTVEAKAAKFYQDHYNFNIVDLPGTYSISAYTPEELYVRKYIMEEKPDVVINVVDASNLERNLYLTSQLIDMDIKVIIALNMYDELEKTGAKFNYDKLGKMLGIPIVPTVSSKGIGIEKLFGKVIDIFQDKDPIVRHIHINYGDAVEKAIKNIQEEIRKDEILCTKASPRFISVKMLEKDQEAKDLILDSTNYEAIVESTQKEIGKIEKKLSDDTETIVTDAKYGFIAGALKETFKPGDVNRRKNTDIIDTLLTHKVLGFPIFLFFMFLTFFSTFKLGAFPMDWIESLVGFVSGLFQSSIPDGPIKDLVIDGIIGGVGGVIVFLPNILILFFFISFMEDTGYMARAAFIMDKLMHKLGLHGKSFIPLIMGFGCNVPAMMATRTLENRNDRLLTMLIIPFMSCSARLPVYILIIGTFFPNNQTLMLCVMYFSGVLLSVIFAKLFKKVIFKSQEAPFVMELPPYRMPTLKSTTTHMWHKGGQYLKKMGGIILISSIVVWALGYFPRDVEFSKDYDTLIAKTETNYHTAKESIVNQDSTQFLAIEKELNHLKFSKAEEQQANSYIGKIGHAIEPVMNTAGFDWKMSVSILAGIVAKEIIVSTMGVLYHTDTEENSTALGEKLQAQYFTKGEKVGQKVFTKLTALSFLLFILIYFPCIAVIATIAKEAGTKWALFLMGYTTFVAWAIATLVYQIGSFFGL